MLAPGVFTLHFTVKDSERDGVVAEVLAAHDPSRIGVLTGPNLAGEIAAGQPAARIHFHDTPWRAPVTLAFKRAGLVLCKRVPARCERGDCLFHLATDVAV